MMLSRIAESLFWLGRFVERAAERAALGKRGDGDARAGDQRRAGGGGGA